MKNKGMFRGIPSIALEDQEFWEEIKDSWQDDKFVYGSLIWNNGNPYIVGDIIENTDEYISLEYWIPVKPETVGQFIGLNPNLVKDKKEVCDGDIVLITDHTIEEHFEKVGFMCKELMTRKYEVFWNDIKWSIRLIADIYEPFPFEAPVFDLPTKNVTYEVIGNIHEEEQE